MTCGTIDVVQTSCRRAWPLCLALAVVAGCGDPPARDPAAAHPLPPFAGDPGQLAWQGLQACADCDGIETHLRLVRNGESRYELIETFLAEDGGARFLERGHWLRDGRLLRLQAEEGGERVFAIEDDGQLSVREADGEAPPGPARRLEPVAP
jgi:hypothetical protein